MSVYRNGLLGLLLLGLAAIRLNAQVLLSEVMFDPLGAERTDEFVELYNSSTMSIDMSGWLLGDGRGFDALRPVAGNGLVLQAGQYAVILDPDYLSAGGGTYADIIPPEALALTIESSTFGANGLSNSTSEAVTLVNSALDTLFSYKYSLDNPPGYSDEKIDLSGGDEEINWANSRMEHGTPGRHNSRTPADIDLALSNLRFENGGFQVGQDIRLSVWVYNTGRLAVGGYALLTFLDGNGNGWPEQLEIQGIQHQPAVLQPGDSLRLTDVLSGLSYGLQRVGLSVSASGDADSTNNILLQEVFVDDPGRIGIRINEIMFQPRSGEGEWIELYNMGSDSIDLRNLYVADARDTVAATLAERLLPPGAFMVLGGDSAILWQYALFPEAVLINRKFLNLNNDFDQLKLMGPSYVVYDRVPYTVEWFGREVDKGVSLEKFNPDFDGHLADSWAASVASSGSTPGRENSVRLHLSGANGRLDITPNPFSPDQDGHEDVAVFRYQLPYPTAFANVKIYDLRGRLVRQLAADTPIASRGQFIWDGRDRAQRISPIGAYICLFQVRQPQQHRTEMFKKTLILIKR